MNSKNVGLIGLALWLASAAPVLAQHAIDGDRLLMHTGDFVPRFANRPGTVLKVAAGQVVTLPADSTFDAIEVAGELRNDPTVNTTLRVTNLQVLQGGRLSLNVPCGRRLDLVIRDQVIDTALDPFQWGSAR